MTYEQLQNDIDICNNDNNRVIKKLIIAYINEHNNIKKGDIIDDGNTRIKVDEMKYNVSDDFYSGKPCMVYYGVRVTKKDVLFKTGEKGRISQNRMND